MDIDYSIEACSYFEFEIPYEDIDTPLKILSFIKQMVGELIRRDISVAFFVLPQKFVNHIEDVVSKSFFEFNENSEKLFDYPFMFASDLINEDKIRVYSNCML